MSYRQIISIAVCTFVRNLFTR